MMKLVVTEPSPRSEPTIASVPVGSVFKYGSAWYLKLAEIESSRFNVWSLTANYKTYFSCEQGGFLVQLANSVEVRVTP